MVDCWENGELAMRYLGRENRERMVTMILVVGERELVGWRATKTHQTLGCMYISYPIKKGTEDHHNHNRQISRKPPPPPYEPTYPHNKTAHPFAPINMQLQ
jgi:hypothetical protein